MTAVVPMDAIPVLGKTDTGGKGRNSRPTSAPYGIQSQPGLHETISGEVSDLLSSS